ncbi:cytochrome c, partial [bacterium]|nr:cytochrome c [bacterium]
LGLALWFSAGPAQTPDAAPPPDAVETVETVEAAEATWTKPQAPDTLSVPLVDGDAARGQQLFQSVCFACHGMNASGQAALGSASLHQQYPWYLVMQLEKFRAGQRGTHSKDVRGQQMRPMSLTLPDEQALRDVALYVTGVEGVRPPVTLTGGDPAAGKEIYTAICTVCHGAEGQGIPVFHSPALAGQADWYLVDAVRKFRDGMRGADAADATGLQMKTIAAELKNDQHILDLVAYLTTLP